MLSLGLIENHAIFMAYVFTYWGSGDIAPRILQLSTGWK